MEQNLPLKQTAEKPLGLRIGISEYLSFEKYCKSTKRLLMLIYI